MLQKLDDRTHILKRPTMYIGAVDLTSSNEYILSLSVKIYSLERIY
jgi:DNA gyrase/topoisomerase IV subunit B